jgi:hypothetical protein
VSGGRWIDRSLITNPFNLCLCVTEKQYKKALDRLKIKPEDRTPYLYRPTSGATVHRFDNQGDGEHAAIVCISERTDLTKNQIFATIAHEVSHLTDYVMQELGEDRPSTEFKAYCVQRMCQSLFNAYDELKKKQKRKGKK